MQSTDPIEHVMVLMLENNSFDHVLGSIDKADGVKANSPSSNSYLGQSFPQTSIDAGVARTVTPDPEHDLADVLVQLGTDYGMGGFVQNYAQSYPQLGNDSRIDQVMQYYQLNSLPVLHRLAQEFTVCDRWFSSLPGPTWPNRLFAMTGTSLGKVTMPSGIMDLNLHWYDQPTVFDRLNQEQIDWKVYFGDIPVSMILVDQWEPENAVRHRPMLEFYADVADASEFPEFAWIEPAYLPPRANDYHPPHDIFDGEQLVASVYNALRGNEELWNTSMLIILFDEHGGFFDHVPPPTAVPPDHHQDQWSFDRYGARVPAILVSPFVGSGVISDLFDHTSLLKYLTDKWDLGPLGQRTAAANSFGNAILPNPRSDAPSQIVVPAIAASPIIPMPELTDHEKSMIALSHALESMAGEDASIIAARSSQVLSGPSSQIDAAVDRVAGFLKHQTSRIL
jgi:phospholipase C